MFNVGDVVTVVSRDKLIRLEDVLDGMFDFCGRDGSITEVVDGGCYGTLYSITTDDDMWWWSEGMLELSSEIPSFTNMTNYEKIKCMDKEEMSDFMWSLLTNKGEGFCRVTDKYDVLTYNKFLEWLDEE